MGFLDKAKEAAQQAAAKAQQQVSTMQQQSAANKASGISTGSRDALLRDLGAAYVALKQGAGSQEAVDAAFTAVEELDTQFANMGSLDDLDTAAGSAPAHRLRTGLRLPLRRPLRRPRRQLLPPAISRSTTCDRRRRSDRRRTYDSGNFPAHGLVAQGVR